MDEIISNHINKYYTIGFLDNGDFAIINEHTNNTYIFDSLVDELNSLFSYNCYEIINKWYHNKLDSILNNCSVQLGIDNWYILTKSGHRFEVDKLYEIFKYNKNHVENWFQEQVILETEKIMFNKKL